MAVPALKRANSQSRKARQARNEVVHLDPSDNIAREPMTPSHGVGKILTPWKPGQSGNPKGRPKVLREVREMAKIESVDALTALIGCYKTADGKIDRNADGRVVAVATQAVLQWAFGKPPEYDPSEDKPLVTTDFRGLSIEEKKLLLGLVRRTVTVDPAAGAASEAELVGSHTTIEVQAEPQTELAAAEKPETAPNEAPAADSPPRGAGRMRIF